ncbi:MAG TPA: acetate--CoA ligase family protein [Methanoregulaceae archaeon]|nr:acetate--CoA ligase family protein [Methanoregulaceae archaeon]
MTNKLLPLPDGYALLKTMGVPVPDHGMTADRKSAEDIAERIGFPLVMKIVSPGVVHKADVGGVITGINNATNAGEAFDRIVSNVKARLPGAEISGVLVEKQVQPGLEIIIGGRTDPSFGKILTIGLGGTFVEIFRDFQIRVLPVNESETSAMIHALAGYPLIAGYRAGPPLDETALKSTISSIASNFFRSNTITEFDINPLVLHQTGLIAVDARFYVTDVLEEPPASNPEEMDPGLLYPQSIAVVGASDDPEKVGYAVLRNLLPFPGDLYPVNPHHEVILGRAASSSVDAIPGPVDLAVIAIPATGVVKVIDDLGRKGVRIVIVVSSGFRESGPDGVLREKELMEHARSWGMRLVGPNTLGIMLPHKKINTTFDPISARPGHIGFISQSGAIITTIVDWSLPEKIGFSAVISVGNQADLGFVDYLKFVSADPDTRAIILYIEEIRDGKNFLRVVTDVAMKKPVIALKSGSSQKGTQAASSHTGSLAGNYAVYQAAFQQAGVISVTSLQDAFSVAELLASEGYPEGNRALIVTAAGGFAVLASDYADRFGIDLIELSGTFFDDLDALLPETWSHENPVDIIGDSGAGRYARTFDVLIQHQDEWDIAFVIAVPSAVLDPGLLAQEIVRFSKSTQKMTVGCLLGGDSMKQGIGILRDNRIPNYGDIEEAFKAVGLIVRSRHCCGRPDDRK